ncbi:hypothetical protein [Solicola sp. PLA-1-18]|uniref:hypothetical protein n=1 Tax=Solicola sp. PLA-1-18 TaxID=3380532 RepID=UPI003B7F9604
MNESTAHGAPQGARRTGIDAERVQLLEDAVGGDVHESGLAEVVALEVGASAGADGTPLRRLYSDLEGVYDRLVGEEPAYEVARALGTGWAEASAAHLETVSCEDPLTGLATSQHLRSRLADVYRVARRDCTSATETHALVIADLPTPAAGVPPLLRSLTMLEAATLVRTVFDGAETIAQLGELRTVALVERTAHVDDAAAAVATLLRTRARRLGGIASVTTLPLPADEDSATSLLGQLAR